MNYRTVFALALLTLTTTAQAMSLCSEKEQNIQREIGYAEKHNNQSRINGLKNALKEVQKNCTDEKLKSSHQKAIAQKRQEIAERKHDLAQARKSGDPAKIAKREQKLAEEEHELKTLMARDY
ncbi:DUF1090 domain-containing protein [Shimwellia blattae]|uniref:Protein YqjC n=1 Tax=Shimwellia blattae (strain ATCC 29907 / DSM 4481 / JCM 1650 / NBRC 105725 / CDC 9005-74) TaxID=630626 RepID=I2B4X9_SHIBC|nr:DUF1090 domain-containing protein [Shimwellia blattae]AFJ45583.1 protein YqjC precursor [Shimwellia blattae DSM 4481 = NBRC 105725]GAB81477.1 hypothetical protein YqjC [Shimwellia blattae DSM 4481 = NBRC 105725]VDY63064.1 Protein of uncharacterised function (DUF1090) [Shimwellia blattae]VEC20229.1 Protein of uncharacterised function (DUF1090) [Shimwellia blattae]